MLGPGLEAAGHVLVDSLGGRRRDGRLHAFPTPRSATCWPPIDAGVPSVVGTTGWDLEPVRDAPVTVFYAPNFALGAVLMMRFAAEAARYLPAAEIVELHHAAKVDRPSGTARLTAELMGGDVPMHSVRLPGLNAHQEVILGDEGRDADDPPRRRLARGVHAGGAARAREAADAAAGLDGRPRRAYLEP